MTVLTEEALHGRLPIADIVISELRDQQEGLITSCACSCCNGTAAVCSDWKTRSAREGRLFTNWCAFPGQICTQNGTLMRLDMRGFNLQCPFPATDMAVFTSLTTLNLGRNPNMTVRSLSPLPHHPLLIHLALAHTEQA